MLSYVFVVLITTAVFMFLAKGIDKRKEVPKFLWVILAVILAIPFVSPFFFEFGDTKWGLERVLSFDEEKQEVRSHPYALWDPPFGNKKWVKVRNQFICESEGVLTQRTGVGGHFYRFPVVRITENKVTVVDINSTVCIADPWAFYQRGHGVGMNTDDDKLVRDELSNAANWVAAQGLLEIESKIPDFRSLMHLTTSECLIEAGSQLSSNACLQVEDEVEKLLTPFVDVPGLRVEAQVSLKHFGLR